MVEITYIDDDGMPSTEADGGRPFPAYNGEVLSWSLHWTKRDRSDGYPRLRAVVRAMRAHRPEQLATRARELHRDQWARAFGYNAKVTLEVVCEEWPECPYQPKSW